MKAFITGVTGQDGAYLSEFLLEKGYEVHGLIRRSSVSNTSNIDALLKGTHSKNFHLHVGDLTDTAGLIRLTKEIAPDEIYNLGAQSHVGVSFESPEFTANVDALGTLRLLEAIRILDLHKTRFYQASSSELFGRVQEVPQRETTPFYPRSPYGVAKLYAYWITINYREAYSLFACNGILFNHESPLRGEAFVTRKITSTLCRIALGMEEKLYLGNLEAKRDWGHARDYVEMQWMILQQEKPRDFVIATGRQHSIRTCVELAAKELGISLSWEGSGVDEKGIIVDFDASYRQHLRIGQEIVAIDRSFFRPTEVDTLIGDPTLAKEVLGWEPKISFEMMIKEMVQEDLKLAEKHCSDLARV